MASGLFDEQFRLQELTKMGDPLEKLSKHLDFELFRNLLDSGFEKYDASKGGRPPFDRVMMFKGLVLKSMYNLSFERLEFLIKDRLSFQRFLGICLGDRVPDANTFWDYNEALTNNAIIDQVFDDFCKELEAKGLIMNNGAIVDASIVDAPVQRNTKDENDQIKQGEKPKGWGEHKSRQKDLDADWTKKHNRSRFGYKNHIKIDKGSKLITNFEVSKASEHDSQVLDSLLENKDSGHEFYGDSAYRSNEIEEKLKEQKIRSRIHKKAYRGNPLSEKDKAVNTRKSKVRARVEHVFGDMYQTMGSIMVRQIGMIRNASAVTMMNICYNMRRSSYLLARSVP